MKEPNIKENLEILPEQIRKKELELIEISNEINEVTLIQKHTKNSTYNLVSDEVTPEGKKAYKNDDLRDAETKKRLQLNGKYIANSEELKVKRRGLREKEIDLEFLKRSFRAAESIARLT